MTHEPTRGFGDVGQEAPNDHIDENAADVPGSARDWDRTNEGMEIDLNGDLPAHYAAVPFRRSDIEEIELRSAMADLDHVFAHANRRQHRKNRNTVEQVSRNRRRASANERFGSEAGDDARLERNRKRRERRREDYQ